MDLQQADNFRVAKYTISKIAFNYFNTLFSPVLPCHLSLISIFPTL